VLHIKCNSISFDQHFTDVM